MKYASLTPQALKDTEYKGWKTQVLDATFPVSSGPDGLMEALDNICMESSEALRGGNCQVGFCFFVTFARLPLWARPVINHARRLWAQWYSGSLDAF